jgi:hypothetical protein
MTRRGKQLEIATLVLSIVTFALLAAAAQGAVADEAAEIVAIGTAALTAILAGSRTVFYPPQDAIRLFYATSEFMEVRDRASFLLSSNMGVESIEKEYKSLDDDYTSLKKKYIEYYNTSVLTYLGFGKRREFLTNADSLEELPPISGQQQDSELSSRQQSAKVRSHRIRRSKR